MIGFFTDVHADLLSLQKVLTALERSGADSLVCLGDLVVHGQRPNEVVDLIRRWQIPTVGGNHDHGAVHYRQDPSLVFFNPKSELHTALTQTMLSEENRQFLSRLPDRLQIAPQISCVHASYRDRYALLSHQPNLCKVFADSPTPVTLCGHTHRTRVHIEQAGHTIATVDPWAEGGDSWSTELDWGTKKYILNCGNTSQLLYDRLPPVYGLLDTSAQVLTWKRVY